VWTLLAEASPAAPSKSPIKIPYSFELVVILLVGFWTWELKLKISCVFWKKRSTLNRETIPHVYAGS
jgi:hypothetical protein